MALQKVENGTDRPEAWKATDSPSLCQGYLPLGLDCDNRIWANRRGWEQEAREKLTQFGLYPDRR